MTNLPIQPTINIGIVGHVDHGKTTLTKLLSGKWTDTHSEEKKRGITIKLGYTNFTIFSKENEFNVKSGDAIGKYSIVDAPGHESFMATMISGAAVMDCALLLVAANEKCPQPQTIEHLKTLELAGIKDIIVIQNKVDLVTKEEALENFKEINEFLRGTVAENAPIIPLSAQHGANLSALLGYISKSFQPFRKKLNQHKQIFNSFS
jgi:translation initiation factor 2 subunit 3